MRVLYINRNINAGYSIHRVFCPIIGKNKNCHQIDVPYSGTNPIRCLSNLWFVFINRKKGEIYHITGDIYYCSLILPSNKTVITYHDAGSLLRNKRSRISQLFFKYFWFYLPIKHACLITCISEQTKKVLIDLFPWSSEKIIVVKNPIGDDFANKEKLFNKLKPIILQIGTGRSKNLPRVVSSLKGISCHLRIIGKLSEDVKRLLYLNNIEFSNSYDLNDQQIIEEYNNCDIVSFPSVHEGFGLPLIEGYASGRVVVTSTIEPLFTISEGAAVLVDPLDVDSIRGGFLEAINNDKRRAELIKQGLLIAEKYKSEVIYKQYEKVYSHLNINDERKHYK